MIAHRGASGHLPEHTLEAYALAIGMGADAIEPDVVLTRDGVAVCSHDITVSNTGVMREMFPERARADGKWYLIDFDLHELRGLGQSVGRAGETLPGLSIATLDECLALVQRLSASTGRTIAVVPEAKDPAFHRSSGMRVEHELVRVLNNRGYTRRTDPAFVQCFDLETLRNIRHEFGCELRLVYLSGQVFSDDTLRDVAGFADAIGPKRTLIVKDDGSPGEQPDLIESAHALGLKVYPYTFQKDRAMIRRFGHQLGADGVFADFPDVAADALSNSGDR